MKKIIRQLGKRIVGMVNQMIYNACLLFPVNSNLIILESEEDFSDNAYAFYEYLVRQRCDKKYKIIWCVENIDNAKKRGVLAIRKWPKRPDPIQNFYLATCRWYIYDHSNMFDRRYKRDGCVVFNLWHGCGVKQSTDLKYKDRFDYITVTGEFYREMFAKIFGCPSQKVLVLGYPRNDYLFLDERESQQKIIENYGVNRFKKIFLWMPTFRRSFNKELDEQYFKSETGLPILYKCDELVEFNHYLKENNALCIFKVHHLQAEMKVFDRRYSNIFVLKDSDLRKLDLQLYEVIGISDCLISDYSSVVNDYMLLDKPIIFTLDDYKEYSRSRGLMMENAKEYFYGYHVEDRDGLIAALDEILQGKDGYKQIRTKNISQMHKYIDGNSSKRIADFLKITTT